MTYPLEQLWRAILRSPQMLVTGTGSGPNTFAGVTTLNSGDVTVPVSTVQVNSDSIIQLTCMSPTAAASGFGHAVDVRSITPGVGFLIGHRDGIGRGPSLSVFFEIKKTS